MHQTPTPSAVEDIQNKLQVSQIKYRSLYLLGCPEKEATKWVSVSFSATSLPFTEIATQPNSVNCQLLKRTQLNQQKIKLLIKLLLSLGMSHSLYVNSAMPAATETVSS